MTEQEIIDGNKLIAEFMDVEITLGKDLQEWMWVSKHEGIKPLLYHSSFDWLTPVVERIESLYPKLFFNISGKDVNIILHSEEIGNHPLYEYANSEDAKIKSVWLAVIDFIKWYNKNSPQPQTKLPSRPNPKDETNLIEREENEEWLRRVNKLGW